MKKNNNLYFITQRLKLIFIFVAAVIIIISTAFTNQLAKSLAEEEKKKIEIWAEATQLLAMTDTDDNMINNIVLKIIEGNTTIPVIITDEDNRVMDSRNIKLSPNKQDEEHYNKLITRYGEKREPIVIKLIDENLYVYYDDSLLLKQLYYFPFVQLSIIVGFMLVAFFALASTKRAEQNQVWVGLSKETAHQLGTPISSLLAWSEILRTKYPEDTMLNDMDKDIYRLKIIAERFSKIGSQPDLQRMDLCKVLNNAVQYVQKRSSKKITIDCEVDKNEPIYVNLNEPLFEWVIENLCKNAIDAMDGEGKIDIQVHNKNSEVVIDVKDTGKGMVKKQYKAVFTPGYTTKKRGWGLGLSLAKRIIEEYHRGRIFVKQSEINKGTIFRIILKKD